jgi:protocatechuate 3,4-dioxygenase beta subunit
MKSIVLAFITLLFQAPQDQMPASIGGVVLRAGTQTPVAGAQVMLGNGQPQLTDDNGRFLFRNLTPGRYRVSAGHKAYMPAKLLQPASALAAGILVSPGETINNLVLTMVPKSAVSGRVRDRDGKAISNALVQALRYTYQDGRRILISGNRVRTDAQGEYRMEGLAPGPYVIGATPPERPPEGVNATETLLPVYYPGTTDVSLASAIDVPPGIDYNGIDLLLSETFAVRVSGRVLNGVTGEPMSAGTLALVPRRGTAATGSLLHASIASGGAFEFRHMAPGSYELVGVSSNGFERLAGSTPVDISGRDVEGLTLLLLPQLSIKGKVRIENFSSDNFRLNNIRVELRREPYVPELLALLPSISPDGTFSVSGLTPGDYQLKLNATPLKGYVKSASFGGSNALNPPFRIDATGELEIVLSLNTGGVDANIVDDAQKPFVDATVVLVPDAPFRQRLDLYEVSGSDASGHAHFEGVAPGDYRLFAWEDIPADAWSDPDFIRTFENQGRPVHVGENGMESIEARVISSRK